MVGASLKSRSSAESCWFSDRTTPRSRGKDFKTQIKRTSPNKDRFGTARTFPDDFENGEMNFRAY